VNPALADPVVICVGAVVTLGVFSYLAKDNPLSRLVQNAALGVSMGIGLVVVWQQVLQPKWWALIRDAFRNGGEQWTGALWLLALVPGSLWYFQLSKKRASVSTLVSGLFIGMAAGVAFKTTILLILPEIGASLKPLNPFAGPQGSTAGSFLGCLNNVIFLVAMLTTLVYFCFSIKADHPLMGRTMRLGRTMIMVALGAMFGNTVMTRMAYLLDRLQFLHSAWTRLMG
jgi:hypothetical protein